MISDYKLDPPDYGITCLNCKDELDEEAEEAFYLEPNPEDYDLHCTPCKKILNDD